MECGRNTSTGSFGDRVAGRDEVLLDDDIGNIVQYRRRQPLEQELVRDDQHVGVVNTVGLRGLAAALEERAPPAVRLAAYR
jgi:hypothetical protein